MVEMEVLDIQVPEQGNLNFFLKQNITRQWNKAKIKAEEQDQAAVNFLAILLRFQYDLKD